MTENLELLFFDNQKYSKPEPILPKKKAPSILEEKKDEKKDGKKEAKKDSKKGGKVEEKI